MNIVCTICYGNFNVDAASVATICGHLFHPGCLERWKGTSNTCPQCRQTLSGTNPTKIYLSLAPRNLKKNSAATSSSLRKSLLEKDEQLRKIHEQDEEFKRLFRVAEEEFHSLVEDIEEYKVKIESLRENLKEVHKVKKSYSMKAKKLHMTCIRLQKNVSHVETCHKDQKTHMSQLKKSIDRLTKEATDKDNTIKQLQDQIEYLKKNPNVENKVVAKNPPDAEPRFIPSVIPTNLFTRFKYSL